MFEKLYAVTVNWNLKADTLECVHSLLDAGLNKSQILVVDNGSTDGTSTALHENYGPALDVIENENNKGYAAGVNLGVRRALELGADWVFLMNNDTIVSTSLLAALEAVAEDAAAFSILGPLIFYKNRPDHIWHCGDRVIPGTLFTRGLYRNQTRPHQMPAITPVDFVSGCGMIIQRHVFEVCGYFDESLFMYGEEVDYCWRARRAGFRLASVTTAHMWHKVSASANRDRPQARYLQLQNQNHFYHTYARGGMRPAMFVLSGLRQLALALRDVLVGQWQLAWPGIVGWWNGWSGHRRTNWS